METLIQIYVLLLVITAAVVILFDTPSPRE
jgi:hypothetical protein